MAKTQNRRLGLLTAVVMCASFVGLAAPTGAQAQQEPRVQFLNPSDYSDVISRRDTQTEDERANTYRLAAWAANPPSNALVEFEVDVGISTNTIGTAEQVTPGVFEFDWDLNEIPIDGEYDIRAILYGGATLEEVASDERNVMISTGDTASLNRPAADIVYPTMAGPAGFYTNPKTGGTNILVDMRFSAGTNYVATYYTVSNLGDEPAWKFCAFDRVSSTGTGGAGGIRLRCPLESIDQGGQFVTAIAVVANDGSPQPRRFDPNFNAGGDVARIAPYVQEAASIVLDPPTLRVDADSEGEFPCSPTISATVSDQLGRPVADMSVDVHAQGPTDQLKFAVGGPIFFASSGSAPDDNHDRTEPQFDCTEQEQIVPNQGDHNVVGGPDIKHVESNTGDSGSKGAFFHTDRPGATQITFWADEDDNDLSCSEEPAAAASIGWGEDAPGPIVMSPAETICPIPEPPDPNQVPECSDGVDNDGDGETDYPEDDGCSSPEDDDESDESEDPRGCTVEGTDDGETITGTDGDDVICGGGGDDIIDGMGGNDVIYGDGGDDEIRGGPGDDNIHGGDGRDTIRGGGGDDTATGNAGNDTILGGPGADSLRGNLGVDTLRGGGGIDDLRGGANDDVLTGGAGGDTLRGGRGIDTLKGRKGHDILRGGRDDDNLRGGRGNDTLNGGPGTDTCRGGRGRDRAFNCER